MFESTFLKQQYFQEVSVSSSIAKILQVNITIFILFYCLVLKLFSYLKKNHMDSLLDIAKNRNPERQVNRLAANIVCPGQRGVPFSRSEWKKRHWNVKRSYIHIRVQS